MKHPVFPLRVCRRRALGTRGRHSAFTLVELLVVIAIIGVLVALLLPAVQAAREAARRAQCTNHLKQIGLGFHLHHDAYNACPTGGAGADPARALVGGVPELMEKQTLGWAYQILPFIEQQNLYNNPSDPVIKETPIKIYFCPSRRPPQVWDINASGTVGKRAQIDYAGNRGNDNNGSNGIVVRALNANVQRCRFSTVTDGLSNTLLASERAWPIDWYFKPGGPENDWFRGGYAAGSIARPHLYLMGTNPPIKDLRGPFTGVAVPILIAASFGSAHPGGINAVLADGSVRTISFSVNQATFLDLARRDDGNTLGEF